MDTIDIWTMWTYYGQYGHILDNMDIFRYYGHIRTTFGIDSKDTILTKWTKKTLWTQSTQMNIFGQSGRN